MEASSTTSQPSLIELPPRPGLPFGRNLRLLNDGIRRVVFVGATPIHVWDASDRAAETVAIAILGQAKVATNIELAQAFDCHRNRVGRLVGRVTEQGMAALLPAKPGPKGPSKVTPEILAVIEQASHLGPAATARLVAQRTGVTLSAERVRQLRLPRAPIEQPALPLVAPPPASMAEPVATAPMVSAEPPAEPPVTLPEQARGRYLGATLYYPALAALGLMEAAGTCFRLPNSEFFGVRATSLTLFFLALFGKTTVEAAKFLRRWEFGVLIGSPRAPVVKTLRRKLAELVRQSRSTEFGRLLARRWVEQAMIATAYLYVDGHMKVYTGKRTLREIWNSQRRMPLPGFATYFVGDGKGRPLLFLTEEAGASLTQAMPAVIGEIRQAVGDRPFTVIFDRGGCDSKLFNWLAAEGVDFITYQISDPELPRERFSRRRARFEGRRVYLSIAEDSVEIEDSGPWRRIVVCTPDGHQTPILTSLRPGLPAAKVACLMFARWRQENFFRYMRQHFGLDQIISYAYQEADGERLVPNPQRRQLDRQIQELRRHLTEIRSELGQALLDEHHDDGVDLAALITEREELMALAREFEEEIVQLMALRKVLPTRVPLATVGQRQQLRLEQKTIVDCIKVTAYNAEAWLLDRLATHYPNPHDIRALLRSFAELSGEIRSGHDGVVITLDAPDNPLHRRALRALCADLNQLRTSFPDTNLPIAYRVAVHHSEAAV